MNFKCLVKFFLLNIQNISITIANILKIKREYNNRLKDKYIVLLYSQAIGPMALFSELAFRYCKNYNIDLNDVLFVSPTNIANKQLFKMIKRKVDILVDDRLFEQINRGGYLYLRYKQIYIEPKRHENGLVYSPYQNVHFSFTDDEIIHGEKLLKNLGIQSKDKIITVNNKDDYYWKKEKGQMKNHDIYRDSDFNSLNESITYLKKSGYKVVRIGHYEDAKAFNYISLNDLSKEEKDFMDIFIIYKSYFSMTGDSGIAILPYIFKVPLLVHNCIPMGESPIFENAIFIPKLMKDSVSDNILSVSEIQKRRVVLCYNEFAFFIIKTISAEKFQDIRWYNKTNIKIIDNTSKEILAGVKDMLEYINSTITLNEEQKKKQNKFKRSFPLNHPMRHFIGYVSPSFMDKYNIVKGD